MLWAFFYFYKRFCTYFEIVTANLSHTNLSENRASGIKHLALLAEIGNALSGSLAPRAAFGRVLELLHREHGMLRGTVMLLDRKSSEIRVEVSHGLTEAGKSARYRLGEGITGRVVGSGKPIVVPQVSREPMFLNRGQRQDLHKQEITFMCVPIILTAKPVGALGVDVRFEKNRDYDSEMKLLAMISAMMAQSVKAEHLVDDERKRLMDENTHLLEELKERYEFSNIIGNAGPMRQVYEQIAQVAHTNTTVMIRGESGTGICVRKSALRLARWHPGFPQPGITSGPTPPRHFRKSSKRPTAQSSPSRQSGHSGRRQPSSIRKRIATA